MPVLGSVARWINLNLKEIVNDDRAALVVSSTPRSGPKADASRCSCLAKLTRADSRARLTWSTRDPVRRYPVNQLPPVGKLLFPPPARDTANWVEPGCNEAME
ncbi:hypothetical protein BN1723_016324 [Verticillium longisporum]|uniref:Uncharacterized protein n=1 Tax=Verticillium longisporum TaxID=100787 RepID=A0A0G4NCG2_VERLO|nr:hypothetical protein BN1723_016324 [Verticillium longisporum]